MTRIFWVLVSLAAVFAAAAGYYALRQALNPQADFIVSGTEQNLGQVNLGIHEVTVQLSNPSKQPRRVVGMTELCTGEYCFMMRHPDDTTVQAGETCLYKFDLLIKKPGLFNAEGTLFLEGNGLQEVPLKIRGVAVLPTEKSPVPKLPSNRSTGLE